MIERAPANPSRALLRSTFPAAVTVAIQALSSLSSLLITWYLIRQIGVAGFGYFAIYSMVAANVASVFLAYLVQPLNSVASKLSDRRQEEFIQAAHMSSLALILGFALIGGAGVLIARAVGSPPEHVLAAAAYAIATSGGELYRRVVFFRRLTGMVLAYDLVRYLLVVAALVTPPYFVASPDAAVFALCLSLTYPLAALPFVIAGPSHSKVRFDRKRVLAQLRRLHRSGNHLSAGVVMRLIGTQLPLFVGFFVLGPYQAGLIRLAQTIVGLTNPAIQAMEHVIPVGLGLRIRGAGSEAAISRYRRDRRLILLGFVGLYAIVIGASPLFSWIMGVGTHVSLELLVAGFCFANFLAVFGMMLEFEVRARERTRIISASLAASAAVAIVMSYPAVAWLGLAGVVSTIVIGQMLGISLLFALSRRSGKAVSAA